ncbi:unnamed protein product [Miscanthus lutarioriparius]|uniref:non-specific serine/threonine protein kinase n=1 Tax=Miscanthus lutarioriparius TaxID=422564 RepID=A0A811MJK7_9POAL|nr:unnamed protein product [Miscanthus lutarioriparius]
MAHTRHRPGEAPARAPLATDQRGVIVFLRPTVGTHVPGARDRVRGRARQRGGLVDAGRIFVFELLYGATPFRGHDDEATVANIVARALEFPRDRDPAAAVSVSPAARDLVAALLVKDPARRLGHQAAPVFWRHQLGAAPVH